MSIYCLDFPRLAITVDIPPSEEPLGFPNPSGRLIHTERSPSGTRHVWLGCRVDIMIDRREPCARWMMRAG